MNDRADIQVAALRLPPHSIEAEQSLLGAMLLPGSDAWDHIADVVTAADFYRDDHRRIFTHIAKMANSGRSTDLVTVGESIERSNEVDQTGGLQYLGEIANNTPSYRNARHYAQIVVKHARLRQLVKFADDLSAQAMNSTAAVDALLDEAQQTLQDIGDVRINSDLSSLRPVLGEVVDKMQQDYDSETPVAPGIPYGLIDLDNQTDGMQPGDMIVIAGRPSMGKTAYALRIAENVGVEQGLPVAIFSLEMPAQQLVQRKLASVSKIEFSKIRKASTMQDIDWDSVTVAMGRMHDAPIFIDDSGLQTIPRIRAKCRRLLRQCGKLGLVVIDYMQLLTPTRQGENRATEVSEMSRGIKLLAKELHCPIIVLSQLNRKVEERHDKRPMMSDLRESGAIEQDADQIHLLYRHEYYYPDTHQIGMVEVNIPKNRNGPTGKVDLIFRKELQRFDNADQRECQIARFNDGQKGTAKPKAFQDE